MSAQNFESGDVNLSLSRTGSGAPFVFQHGLCGDAAQPAQVFPVNEGFECLTLECRGHGASDPGSPESYSIASFADDVARLIESTCHEPVVLGGISMGAAIALRLAVTRPDLIKALVLARPAWLVASNPENMQPNALVGRLLHDCPPDEARLQFDASAVAALLASEAPDNLASLRSFFARLPLEVTSQLLMRISADGPGVTAARVRSIAVPTLVIGHACDFIHPLRFAKELVALIPSARFAEITPKAESAERYRADFRSELSKFMKEL
jgi:pimeloyl-ACP methyl ester carboxylesterase